MSRPIELDIDFARRQFPAPAWEWAFFENAGGSFVPQSVIDRLTAYMTETQVQPGATFRPSALAAERMADGHRRISEMINADPDEVIIGPSTTSNIYVLARALLPMFDDGGELVVTNLDHAANSDAWRRLADSGVTVREWRIDAETAELAIEDLEDLLNDNTRLVCFPHCSNIAGGINDVAAITRKVHRAGAQVCVDGVAYAPHRALDVKALDVDYYAFSLYKMYGPHLGLLYGKRERLLAAKAQNHFFIGEDDIPLKLNPGGPNHELCASIAGTADYFEALDSHHFGESNLPLGERVKRVFALFAGHEEKLARRFVDFIAARPGLRLIGRATSDMEQRAPTFSLVVEGKRSADIPPLLEPARVAIRSGDFYAFRLIRDLGIDPEDGVVRASMAHYNSVEEVDRLIEALDRAI